MSALFRKAVKARAARVRTQPTYAQPVHFTVVPDDPIPTLNPLTPTPSCPLVRWVEVGGKVFAVTPHTFFRGILSNGEDYYPYYDDNLRTIADDDLDNYPPGDNYSHPAFQSLRRHTH